MAPPSVMLLVCILFASQQVDAHKETFTAPTIPSNDEMFLSTIINQLKLLNALRQKDDCSRNSNIINNDIDVEDDQIYSTHKYLIKLVLVCCTCLVINTILLSAICRRNNQMTSDI
eukprot:384098_1